MHKLMGPLVRKLAPSLSTPVEVEENDVVARHDNDIKAEQQQ